MKLGEAGVRRVVLVYRNGVPTRVFRYDRYENVRRTSGERVQRVKPWQHRRDPDDPDPLGAIDGEIVSGLSRSEIYQ